MMKVSFATLLVILLCEVDHITGTIQDDRNPGFMFDNHPGFILSLPANMTNVKQMSTKVSSKMSCVFACVQESWCRSVNFKNTPQMDGHHICELIATDNHTDPKHLKQDEKFTYLNIKNPCERMPCLNKGKCIPHKNRLDYRCKCRKGYTGDKCQNDKFCDVSNPCQNGGTCIDIGVKDYSCRCPPNFSGVNCTVQHYLRIFVQSEGCDDNPGKRVGCGTCMIKVNNVKYCPKGRGHNIVVLDKFGAYQKRANFDTHDDKLAGHQMKSFLDGLPNDSIVLIAVQDSGEQYVGHAESALLSVGAVNPTAVLFRSSWLLVGYKGGSPSWITEKRADRHKGPSQATVKIPVPIE